MAPKKPAKRRPAPSKPPVRTRALRAGGVHVRTHDAAPAPSADPNGLFMVDALGRAMTAYAELPARLLACRSPAEFWGEYLRFGQRLFSGFKSNMPSPATPKSPRKRRRQKAGK